MACALARLPGFVRSTYGFSRRARASVDAQLRDMLRVFPTLRLNGDSCEDFKAIVKRFNAHGHAKRDAAVIPKKGAAAFVL